MSDFRLSHEEGFVEDEVEVRGEEYTLRGGQESYRRLSASEWWYDGEIKHPRYRYSSKSWCVAF